MFAIVFLTLVATVTEIKADFPCTDVKTVDDFKMDAFAKGLWYEVARYQAEWEDHAECAVVSISHVGNSYKYGVFDVYEKNHHPGNFSGEIKMESPGVLSFISPVYKKNIGTEKMTTRIVAMDYDVYGIFYECEYDASKKTRKEHVWVGSRTKTLDSKTKKIVADFFAANNKYLDMSRLIWTKYSDEACKLKP